MDTWVHQRIRTICRRRVVAWCLVAGSALLFALGQHRYISNFIRGPFDVRQAELDTTEDVSAAPRYFVRVTGSRLIDTGIQRITTKKRAGVESRSVSATYYALVIGDRLLIVKRSEGTATMAQGELIAMPEDLQRHLFNTPQMQAIRGRFYPMEICPGRCLSSSREASGVVG